MIILTLFSLGAPWRGLARGDGTVDGGREARARGTRAARQGAGAGTVCSILRGARLPWIGCYFGGGALLVGRGGGAARVCAVNLCLCAGSVSFTFTSLPPFYEGAVCLGLALGSGVISEEGGALLVGGGRQRAFVLL